MKWAYVYFSESDYKVDFSQYNEKPFPKLWGITAAIFRRTTFPVGKEMMN